MAVRFATLRINTQLPVIGLAVHDGHELRPDVARKMVLPDAIRRREEDPHTGALARALPTSLVVNRSRFEVDLNRPRNEAVYRTPDDAWGLELWESEPNPSTISTSLSLYDAFYRKLEAVADQMVDLHGGFVLYDIHSYNHRREGPGAAPAPVGENPEVNLGTASLPPKWKPVAGTFLEMARWEGLDGRENVKFQGRQVAAWVHDRFGEVACAFAIEFKKSFMDEWTDEIYDTRFEHIRSFVRDSTVPVLESWREQCR
jgi:N-formylglutamate deformylase